MMILQFINGILRMLRDTSALCVEPERLTEQLFIVSIFYCVCSYD